MKITKESKVILDKVLNFIKQDPHYAYYYTLDVIKGRWPEAEEVIKQDPRWWYQYKMHFNLT